MNETVIIQRALNRGHDYRRTILLVCYYYSLLRHTNTGTIRVRTTRFGTCTSVLQLYKLVTSSPRETSLQQRNRI